MGKILKTEKNKILAIIPARGGSKRLPGKNIKPLLGKPLIAYTIQAAQGSRLLDKIVVSTEDSAIAAISKEFGAEIIERPEELAQDDSKSIDVVLHTLDYLARKNYIPDVCVFLQPTSPLRDSQDIDAAIEMFLKNKAATAISVDKTLGTPNGAIYIMAVKDAYKNKSFFPKGEIPFMPYIMEDDKSIDIDYENDFKLAEQILKQKKYQI